MKEKGIFSRNHDVTVKLFSHVGHMTPTLLTCVCPALANYLCLHTGKQGTKEAMPNVF